MWAHGFKGMCFVALGGRKIWEAQLVKYRLIERRMTEISNLEYFENSLESWEIFKWENENDANKIYLGKMPLVKVKSLNEGHDKKI